MKINGTDVVFAISFIVSELTMFSLLASSLVPHTVLLWIGVITGLLQGAAYMLYERINGTLPPPTPPTTPTV